MSEYMAVNTETVELTRRKFGSMLAMMPGIFDLDHSVTRDYMTDALAHRLTACVLAHEGGEPATDTVTVLLALRPRFFPRWLWRRMPTKSATWTLTAQPEWVYPYSTVVPKLGEPVRFIVPRLARGDQ